MCGSGMVAGRSKGSNGTTYRNYVCGQQHNKGKTACRANSIRADKAESEVFKRLSNLISSPSVLKMIIEKVNQQRITAEQPLLEQQKLIKNKLNQTTRKLDNLLDALAEGSFSKATLLLSNFQTTLKKVDVDQRKALLRMIVKEITISKDAPYRIGRHIEKINLHFDFTFEAMTNNFELIKELYPAVSTGFERH